MKCHLCESKDNIYNIPEKYINLSNIAINSYNSILEYLILLTNNKLDNETYNLLLNNIINKLSYLLKNNYRITITFQDGNVIYDSFKNNNSYNNFLNKNINENHNSRLSILQALLDNDIFGISFESKISTTTGKLSDYVAIRIGKSKYESLGCYRLSI